MKYVFKSKYKRKYNFKILSKIIFLTFILIIVFTFFLLIKFSKNISSNLINISSLELNRVINVIITDKINNKIINKDTINDILIINKNNKDEITVPGCIIKRLKRENVIPIYIEDICLGYYYIECKNDEVFKGRLGINDPMLGNNTNRLKLSDNMTTYDKTIRSISNKISTVFSFFFLSLDNKISLKNSFNINNK